MVAFVNANPDKFPELINLALSINERFSARAAWLLSNCMVENDKRLKDHIGRIIEVFPQLKDGHKRDLINVLRKMELDEDQEGVVFDICSNAWLSINSIPSVRYVAMQLIFKIADRHPELYNEIELLTQNQYIETLSSGIKRSINRSLKEFKNKHENL